MFWYKSVKASFRSTAAKPIFKVHDPKGLAIRTQLRVGFSKRNFHKSRHNFKDTINQMCSINDGIEDTQQVLLSCYLYDVQRHDLLGTVNAIWLTKGLSSLSDEMLLRVLLYGDERLSL